MQLYFRCLVTMLIPPLQVKDDEVKKTFSSEQLSSRPALTVSDESICERIHVQNPKEVYGFSGTS